MCNSLKINTQLYYYHLNIKNKNCNKWYLAKKITNHVQVIYNSSNLKGKGGVYGSRKIAAVYNSHLPNSGGKRLTRFIVLQIMKYLEIQSYYHKKQNKQQKAKKSNDYRYAKNILNRQYNAGKNTVVSSDLTYVPTRNGMYYICFITDLWNKEIVGFSISNQHNTTCVIEAIKAMTVPISSYKLFHSDRGGEFSNNKLKEKLKALNVKISMSLPGCPYDNAISENIFKLLKCEGIDDYYKDINKLYDDVRNWVNWYNNIRVHSGLEYKSPSLVRKIAA